MTWQMKHLNLQKHFQWNIGCPRKPLVHPSNGIFLCSSAYDFNAVIICVLELVHNTADVQSRHNVHFPQSPKVGLLYRHETAREERSHEEWTNGRTYRCVSHGTSDGRPSLKCRAKRCKLYCSSNKAFEMLMGEGTYYSQAKGYKADVDPNPSR